MKWAASGLAVIVLLPAAYLSGWIVVHFAWGAGYSFPPFLYGVIDFIYGPLNGYTMSDKPGAEILFELEDWAYLKGMEYDTAYRNSN